METVRRTPVHSSVSREKSMAGERAGTEPVTPVYELKQVRVRLGAEDDFCARMSEIEGCRICKV